MIVDCKDFPTALKIAETDWKKKSNKSKPTNFQEATEIMCDAMKLMIISKNHKYGKNNILRKDFCGEGLRLCKMILNKDRID